MTANNIMERILDSYWACGDCLKEAGGEFIPKHSCTVMEGTCKVCGNDNVTLIPWVDLKWKKDKTLDNRAKLGRD